MVILTHAGNNSVLGASRFDENKDRRAYVLLSLRELAVCQDCWCRDRSVKTVRSDRFRVKWNPMKLSIIILCWNDLKVISDCLQSIYADDA